MGFFSKKDKPKEKKPSEEEPPKSKMKDLLKTEQFKYVSPNDNGNNPELQSPQQNMNNNPQGYQQQNNNENNGSMPQIEDDGLPDVPTEEFEQQYNHQMPSPQRYVPNQPQYVQQQNQDQMQYYPTPEQDNGLSDDMNELEVSNEKLVELLTDFEKRLTAIESTLFRLKNSL